MAIRVEDLTVSYGAKRVLHGISFAVEAREIFAIIGPAQSGKTTLLKVLNRTVDLAGPAEVRGRVDILGADALATKDVVGLRRRVGMVAPLPVGLPMSIYDNVAFAPRCAGVTARSELDARVERCLRQAALWEEVETRLGDLGTKLSGGQQQRLAIARALSHEPEILCLDEFSIAIDPVTTARIEEALVELSARMTIMLVTNLTTQARRLAQRTMFLWNGEIVELGPTGEVFGDNPRRRETYEYVRGVFG
jgi:phosphate transport system ATP-binding protein